MSDRTKHTDIPSKVRHTVKERDKQRCVYCGYPYALQIAHVFVNRSHGGLGVKENLVTLCIGCHSAMDNGKFIKGKPIRDYCEAYLRERYKVDVEKLKYRKWKNDI
jgi:5-methylcytosine-specific restriction endonuclease McrA